MLNVRATDMSRTTKIPNKSLEYKEEWSVSKYQVL